MLLLRPRALLVFTAAILVVGGAMHAAAFRGTLAALATSDLAPFYSASLKALWLIDSATLITLAMVFGLVAFRPEAAAGVLVVLLALVPGATALFLYRHIGNFPPAHMLLASAAAAVVAGLELNAKGGLDRRVDLS